MSSIPDRIDTGSNASFPEGGMAGALARLHDAADAIADATGQAFYVWDIRTDRIEWSRSFSRLAGLSDGETRHLSGRSFESMLSSQSQDTRFGIILSADAGKLSQEPVSYQCIYLLHPDPDNGRPALWLEDTGCWLPGEDGKPARAEGSVRVINDRRKQEDDLRRKSDFDDLTGLPNRRSLERNLETAIRDAENTGTLSTFVIVAIDRMDSINDTYGFELGDEVLRQAAQRISGRLRASDLVCRLSGAKFGLILRKCPPAEIFDAVERVLDALSQLPVDAGASRIPINAQAGVCFLPRHADRPSMAMGTAFKALRATHGEASCRISVYSAHDSEENARQQRARLTGSILECLEHDTFEKVFLDRAIMSDGQVMRELQLRLPQCFITGQETGLPVENLRQLAHELGLIRQIDFHLMDAVLFMLESDPGSHFVLDAARETVLESDWISRLSSGLAGIEGGAGRLTVGFSERFVTLGSSQALLLMDSIRALGCRVKMNRFTASPESIAGLSRLPVDMVLPDRMIKTAARNVDGLREHLDQALDIVRAMGIDILEEPDL